jgi:hypothetical protein
MRKYVALLLCITLIQPGFAQESALTTLNRQRHQTNKTGMIVLGSWAVGNIIAGSIGASRSTGTTKAFYQMNAYWNVVNLAIAGLGFYSALHGRADLSLSEALQEQHKYEKLFLINAGIDLAYIAGGLYLTERGKSSVKNAQRFKGFGRSIMLQGAFLLLFDGVMYGIQHNRGKGLYQLVNKVQLTAAPQSVGLIVRL